LEGEYIRQKLEQAMAKLPPKQKAIFSLRYFEEKSYAEMSAIFTTSEGALKASYHHAVKKIEAFLRN
jgi:RNA polymerase sigma factor (sigma-70 family)